MPVAMETLAQTMTTARAILAFRTALLPLSVFVSCSLDSLEQGVGHDTRNMSFLSRVLTLPLISWASASSLLEHLSPPGALEPSAV